MSKVDCDDSDAPAPASNLAFCDAERNAVYRAIFERRDMRNFAGGSVAPELMRRLLDAAHHAPSVGFMQPWRFVRVASSALRHQLHALVEQERLLTARALGEREEAFMQLKVEGLLEAAELWVVALSDGREKHVFGRRTLPQMDLASAACAIQNLWLAARAEGLGMGWVSLFDPVAVATLLQMPCGADPIADYVRQRVSIGSKTAESMRAKTGTVGVESESMIQSYSFHRDAHHAHNPTIQYHAAHRNGRPRQIQGRLRRLRH